MSAHTLHNRETILGSYKDLSILRVAYNRFRRPLLPGSAFSHPHISVFLLFTSEEIYSHIDALPLIDKNLLAWQTLTLDRYPLQTSATLLNYEFFSEGPKGKIKKVVRYDLRNVHGRSYFNLGFGDWNDQTKKIDDASVSDNGDRTKYFGPLLKQPGKLRPLFLTYRSLPWGVALLAPGCIKWGFLQI